jgi:hypothetical protein
MSDEDTATLTVARPRGQQFGITDFKAYNINFENRAVSFDVILTLIFVQSQRFRPITRYLELSPAPSAMQMFLSMAVPLLAGRIPGTPATVHIRMLLTA